MRPLRRRLLLEDLLSRVLWMACGVGMDPVEFKGRLAAWWGYRGGMGLTAAKGEAGMSNEMTTRRYRFGK